MDILNYFVEIRQFGEDARLTASFLILAVLILWQWVAYTRQNSSIWKRQSAESIDASVFIYHVLMMAGALYYGLATHKLAILLTGTMVIIMIPIMVGVWKFGQVETSDKVILLLGVAWLGAYALIDPRIVYAGFSVGGIAPFAKQLRRIYREEAKGDLHLGWMFPLGGKLILWIIYAYASSVRDIVYMIAAPSYLFLLIWLMVAATYYELKRLAREMIAEMTMEIGF